MRLGWPTTLTLCTQFAAPLCMLGTLGTLGPEYLGGGGMGFMYQNLTGYGVFVGLSLGAQPLLSPPTAPATSLG